MPSPVIGHYAYRWMSLFSDEPKLFCLTTCKHEAKVIAADAYHTSTSDFDVRPVTAADARKEGRRIRRKRA